jgi:hypothetical protein
MTTSTVTASFLLSDGTVADMSSSITDNATDQQLLTSTVYSVTASTIGTFAEGKSIVQIIQPPTALSGTVFYSYISRRGNIQMLLPVADAGVQWMPEMPYARLIFQAGDTIVCFTQPDANAPRTCAYSCITNTGTHAIFSGSAASGNVALTHILSGASIGGALTNQAVSKHFFISDEGALLTSGGGVYILDDRGLPRGGCVATDPSTNQMKCNDMGLAQIFLNYSLRVTCSA